MERLSCLDLAAHRRHGRHVMIGQRLVRSAVLAVVLLTTVAPTAAAHPLTLEEVLASVQAHHPLRGAALATVERAAGQLLAAEGAFDPVVRVRAQHHPVGYYDPTTVDAEVRVLTALRGLTPFAGWRLGRGELPVYDWKQRTLSGGELRVGFELPLLRDGEIDRPRSELARAELSGALAVTEVRLRELELQRDAALAYWDWVAAGHRLAIYEAQLALARDRDVNIRQAIAAGNLAPIERTDNARSIAAREAELVRARREVIQTGLELSLHLRASNGNPVMPGLARLPPLTGLPPPGALELDVEAAVSRAIEVAPSLASIGLRMQATEIDRALARNARLPTLTVSAFAARGLGPSDATIPDREHTQLGLGLVFELPAGMRTASGQLAIADADRRRLGLERQYVREYAATTVRIAHAELRAARERADLARVQAELAVQLAAAERTRFERGDSTLFVVNLREETAADAQASAIDARVDLRKAHAVYSTLLGVSLATAN